MEAIEGEGEEGNNEVEGKQEQEPLAPDFEAVGGQGAGIQNPKFLTFVDCRKLKSFQVIQIYPDLLIAGAAPHRPIQ